MRKYFQKFHQKQLNLKAINMATSIQGQIMRLREDVTRITEERNRIRNELNMLKEQWERIDRPRLLNMLFIPQNQESVAQSTLSQIMDKFQNDVLTPPNSGGSGSGTGTEGHSRSLEYDDDELETIPIFERQEQIQLTDPRILFNRPIEAIIRDFKILIHE